MQLPGMHTKRHMSNIKSEKMEHRVSAQTVATTAMVADMDGE